MKILSVLLVGTVFGSILALGGEVSKPAVFHEPKPQGLSWDYTFTTSPNDVSWRMYSDGGVEFFPKVWRGYVRGHYFELRKGDHIYFTDTGDNRVTVTADGGFSCGH